MTLSDFLAALNNPQAVVTVVDSDSTELVKVNAAGYAQLLSTLLARTVDKVTISNANAVSVLLQQE